MVEWPILFGDHGLLVIGLERLTPEYLNLKSIMRDLTPRFIDSKKICFKRTKMGDEMKFDTYLDALSSSLEGSE